MDEFPTQSADSRSWRLWNCCAPLGRSAYLVIGMVMMLLKYGVEASVIKYTTGLTYSLLDFINPLMSARQQFLRGAPEWFGIAWIIWTLPFVVIAVTLTQRRAVDAGFSPWWGLAILVPLVNFAVMIVLAAVPTHWASSNAVAGNVAPSITESPHEPSSVSATFVGIALAALYATIVSLVCIYGFDSYGSALFFGVPIVSGAAAAFQYNLRNPRPWPQTLGVAMLPMICLGCVFLLFALEGLICIVMAAPIMLPLSIVGGLIGKNIAALQRTDRTRDRQLAGCLVALPIFAFGESHILQNTEYCVETNVLVAASPDRVWPHVIDFPPIASPQPWLFHLGIAEPRSARLEGRGVGAIRYCQFTTGPFVEPITVWDEPKRLGFTVTRQPAPLIELTPYTDVHPPHLHGAFRSTRGEFVLEPLAGGGTRLIGRTWYRLELAPRGYWTSWADWILHRIHGRVLEHIKASCESSPN